MATQQKSKYRIKSDLGTEDRVKDEVYKDEPIGLTAGSQLRRRILSQNLIDRYYQRGFINSRQYNTAQYLHRLYQRGNKIAGMKYDARVDGGSNSFDSDNVGFAEYMKAMRELPSHLFSVVQWIVIDGSTATSLDEKEYQGRRISMKRLKESLNWLANYFGI